MGTITSNIGLISGINTGAIIDGLISIDSEPINLLQTQINAAESQSGAYNTIETQLTSMQSIGQNLALPQTFQNATATSSNPNALTATTAVGAAVGSYQFQVAQLVSTQQTISNGFTSTTAPIGAGTITLEEGGGEAYSQTPLADLNGGAGVTQGQFRITDRNGNSAVIDTSSDITLDDVVKQINNALGISVQATVTDQGLQITDESGGSGTLSIQDLNGGTTAKELGISGTATGSTLTGSNINFITSTTSLAQLNDGNGVGIVGGTKPDFQVTTSDGSTFNISLSGAATIGDVITDINTVGGSKLSAAINSAGNGITLTDSSGGSGTFAVAAPNGSTAATNLGLTGTASGNAINGVPLISGLDSVLVRSLNGGSGIALGNIGITDAKGDAGTINLAGATSLSDVINAINNNTSGVKVTASINQAGTGLLLTDNSGGNGSLTVANAGGDNVATALGIAGTSSTGSIAGANLQRQYISANTTLSTYGGGAGVPLGQFQIENSKGGVTTIDLTHGTYNTVGDILNAINSANAGVTASINSTGNGIALTDTAGGAGTLTVTDLNGGTTAASLNITGTATAGTIDGCFRKRSR